MVDLAALFGTRYPLIQAPMAGVQGSALAIAVGQVGALGSLPAAMLSPDALRAELSRLREARVPYNVNFFAPTPPAPDADAEARWRAAWVIKTIVRCAAGRNAGHLWRPRRAQPYAVGAMPLAWHWPLDGRCARGIS